MSAIVEEIDGRGLLCPLPVLKLRKRLQGHPSGVRVALLSTDPAAHVDVPHFCAEAGHRLVSAEDAADGATRFIVEKG